MLQWRIGWNIPIKVDSKRKYNLRGGGRIVHGFWFFHIPLSVESNMSRNSIFSEVKQTAWLKSVFAVKRAVQHLSVFFFL